MRELNLVGLYSETNTLTITMDNTHPTLPSEVTPCTPKGVVSPTIGRPCDGSTATSDCSHGTVAGLGNADVNWFQPRSGNVTWCWATPGFGDGESTLRSIEWTLYEVSKADVSQLEYKAAEVYATAHSRQAEAAGTVDTSFEDSLYGSLRRGLWYKLKLTAKNGADLTSEMWTTIFSFDDTTPDTTDAWATLCPPTGALRVDLRTEMDCATWPSVATQDVDRWQYNTSLLMVRWKGIVDPESQVVWCELRVHDHAGPTEVWHEANIPCDETNHVLELHGLSLQHTHTYSVEVTVYNGAGLQATLAPTKTVYVDTTPPNISLVRVWDEANMDSGSLQDDTDVYGWVGGHHGAAIHLQSHPQTITCSWAGFVEDDATSIIGYRWAVSSSLSEPYAPLNAPHDPWDAPYDNVMPWSELTASSFVAASNFTIAELEPHVLYRCLVVAVNAAGLTSDVAWSDGFTFDDTHPVNGTVIDTFDYRANGWVDFDGHRVDVDYTPQDRLVIAVWWGFNDTEYGLRSTAAEGEIDTDHGWEHFSSLHAGVTDIGGRHDELGVSHYEAGIGPCNAWQSFALLPMDLALNHTFTRTESGGSCSWESVTTTSVCTLPHASTYCTVVRAQNSRAPRSNTGRDVRGRSCATAR